MARKKKNQVEIKLVRSPIGYSKKQKATLKALGLKKVNQVVVQDDNDVLRGMINKVAHLVAVEKV